ncbi:hypothetical protein phytr_6680 [Candidatus Phycorickettsia trachydisci]|uniref:Uncharacterized protein n=2 Tax=Candidatus Phycorickettsia trachydisci TaxID=2115978 RepID=A0A2P1P8L0_9RICK|nr:hypothetical protein phytr_6680 [Candidatus Phycorickettsia trachydisci]
MLSVLKVSCCSLKYYVIFSMFNHFRHFIMKKIFPLIFVAFIFCNSFASSNNTPKDPPAPTLPNKETNAENNSKTDTKDTDETKQKDKAQDKKSKESDGSAAYQKAIADFKAFVLKTKPKVREEVNEYRAAIAKLEKQKAYLYKKLTLEAQEFLAKEAKLKKALPIQIEETKK